MDIEAHLVEEGVDLGVGVVDVADEAYAGVGLVDELQRGPALRAFAAVLVDLSDACFDGAEDLGEVLECGVVGGEDVSVAVVAGDQPVGEGGVAGIAVGVGPQAGDQGDAGSGTGAAFDGLEEETGGLAENSEDGADSVGLAPAPSQVRQQVGVAVGDP